MSNPPASWGERVADYLLREADKPRIDPLENAMALLKRYRADVLASAPALREAVLRAADERERASRAERECARLRAEVASLRQEIAERDSVIPEKGVL